MDLPIDHFRLLGVHPATDPQAVLNTLQQRLENPPREGFTDETLKAREELLRASADLLSDQARRRQYENTITALAGAADPLMPALEVPYSLETGGLLLLLEAGQGGDCLELTCRALQPPQAPALGSGREADLALLAGLASRASADELKQLRRFEQAAQTLDRGLHLLQRMGQRPDLRQQIAHELDRLAPFRVLDLISRDLSARAERQQGLDLLEELVQRRGGLDGEGDPEFSPEEFRLFFRQIRDFLTVQEQVDLFSRWGDNGSVAADRLAINALTASGFAQRKPERIAEARRRLEAGLHQQVEPALGHLHLLLGEVDRAQDQGPAGADPLAELCSRCREWLRTDVLPGYRDLEPNPDLESYFSDRDVQTWVEREDRRSGRHYAASGSPAAEADGPALTPGAAVIAGGAAAGALAGAAAAPLSDFELPPWPAFGAPASEPPAADSATASSAADRPGGSNRSRSRDGRVPLGLPPLRWPSLSLPAGRPLLVGAGAMLLAVLGLWGLQRRPAPTTVTTPPALRPQPGSPPGESANPSPASLLAPFLGGGSSGSGPAQAPVARGAASGGGVGAPGGSAPPAPPRPAATRFNGSSGLQTKGAPGVQASGSTVASADRPAAVATTAPPTSLPLRTADPDVIQLRFLLESWLAAKARVLAGMPLPSDLEELARTAAIERLMDERSADKRQGLTQHIKVRIKDLRIEERSPDRIALVATLLYSDELRDASGKVVERTPEITLSNLYVFGRDREAWRFVANRPAP